MYIQIHIYSIYNIYIYIKNLTNLVRPTFYSYFKESFSGEYHKRDNNKFPLL